MWEFRRRDSGTCGVVGFGWNGSRTTVSKAHKKKRSDEKQKAGAEAARADGGRTPRPKMTGFGAKRPVLGFVVLFAVLMGGFYAVTWIPYVEQEILPAYMKANASASTAILNLFGEGATRRGTSVSSPRYSVDIRHGCDAIEPSMLFLAAVLAFPAPFKTKLPGVLVGTIVLAIVNLIRIVTLFYTGIYKQSWFEIMHVDVWQTLFVLLSLTFWVIWALWATRPPASKPDAAPQTN